MIEALCAMLELAWDELWAGLGEACRLFLAWFSDVWAEAEAELRKEREARERDTREAAVLNARVAELRAKVDALIAGFPPRTESAR